MLSIATDGDRVFVFGHLDGTSNAAIELERAFSLLPRGAWVVAAAGATVEPAGVSAWIAAAAKHLGAHRLTYAPSQLGMLLELDERYDWHRADFGDQYAAA